jgi:hypothetical protein
MFLALSGATINDQLPAFSIGCWNYAPVGIFDEAKIQEWQEVGFTLTMGPEFQSTPENIARMKQVLDWSAARNIKLIVCDPRTHSGSGLPTDFADQAGAAAHDFAAHPAWLSCWLAPGQLEAYRIEQAAQ